MAEIFVKVPENQVSFVLDLLKKLGYTVANDQDIEVPDWHKEVIRKRIKNSNKDSFVDRNTVKKSIRI